MIRNVFIVLAMAVAIGGSAQTVATAAEGCAEGHWRGPNGACHPYLTHGMCPVGYHLGPDGGRCWPNGHCPPGWHIGVYNGHCFRD